MNGYVIVLTNGKIVYLNADEVEWCEKSRMVRFIHGKQIVARINMDNVVGWIDMDYTTDRTEVRDEGQTIEKESEEGQKSEWMYSIFNEDKIKEWRRQLTKEAEESGMTLTEYLELNPLKQKPCADYN